MDWKEIVSLVISLLGLAGLGTAAGLFWKDIHEKRKKEAEETKEKVEQADQANHDENVKKIALEAVDPYFVETNKKLDKIIAAFERIETDMLLLKKGEQATQKYNLDEMYDYWSAKGYCPRDVKEKFDYIYDIYHRLGKNGVMDDAHQKLLALPDTPPKKPRTKKVKKEE